MSISTRAIRSKFLDFFAKNNHIIVPSSLLLPQNDPTLMFVNSGMVQFKNFFTGIEKPPYKKAASAQKSVRAGGKHNDLDNVGYTTRHHTFFEMLGNFSFGDYFKEQAIYYAWELLTKDFGLPKEKLYVTIYHDDIQASNYWRKIASLPDDHIIPISSSDNFWSMGETGPCGPCSEIFYDHGDKISGGLPGTKDQDGDRYVEIWNMVFMQYQQIDKHTRIPLPMQSIDTGMGLERIAAVLQGKTDNYETDCLQSLVSAVEEITEVKADSHNKFSHRIIADHLRSSAFLIADGILPSNEGRGYVLRRIMRRSMRHMHQLGAKEPMMYLLLGSLIQEMGDVYPELIRANSLITETLKHEEQKFQETLSRGLKILDQETNSLASNQNLSGLVAFKLYDTYGFPLDLTQDILKERNISLDVAEFDLAMQEQKLMARKAWVGSGQSAQNQIWFDVESSIGASEFLGYSFDKAQSLLSAIIYKDQTLEQFDLQSEEFWLISNQTPFYAESGGQKGDIGKIYADNFSASVIDTKKFLGLHAHLCKLDSGCVVVGQTINMQIDSKYRADLARNHSATHLLHSAVKQVLGSHVVQRGSLVSADRLRFDINHSKQITPDELNRIENIVNSAILANLQVSTLLMDKEKAIQTGALALFGEKYDDQVRVVSLQDDAVNLSVELCGGTHVKRSGDIGSFKIISEGSIASGIRRIEAITGVYALELAQKNERDLKNIQAILQCANNQIEAKLAELSNNLKIAAKDLLLAQTKILQMQFINQQEMVEYQNNKILFAELDNHQPKALKAAAQTLAGQNLDAAIVIINYSLNSPAAIIIEIAKNSTSRLDANKLLQQIFTSITGSGGGSKNLAQGTFQVGNKWQIGDLIRKLPLDIALFNSKE